MRHVKKYNELFEAQMELTREQIEWLDKGTDGHWFHNPETGLVNVDGDFGCGEQGLTDLKGVRFGVVTLNFYCHNNSLTSLEGAPRNVGGSFYCSHNRLTSLEGAPREVEKSFYCRHNQLTSLEGAPFYVGLEFEVEGNPVSEGTLKGIRKKMNSGMSWPNAVASYWNKIKSDEDKILLAQYNPKLSPVEIKGYGDLAKFRNKII
jgi:hypothetical protein